jgi:hypothetical protein
MDTTFRSEAPRLAGLPAAPEAPRRIVFSLSRALDFARKEPQLEPSQRVAFALRPLLALALTTAGLCNGQAAAGGQAAEPSWSQRRRTTPAGSDSRHLRTVAGAAGDRGGGDTELLFTALSSLVEVVKRLTPGSGRIYANLGHQPLLAGERSGAASSTTPRSEVVLELLSIAAAAQLDVPELQGRQALPAHATPAAGDAPPAPPADPPAGWSPRPAAAGALAFELAVVGAILESKGGQLSVGSPGGCARSFVVRLPVHRSR